ncbi:MAG TPA: ABC transporter ATP-binding protein, partial [Streptosporangiaceae bacterium]|nr:ABC transporter ATP-binding protein [Streptosporangiaceae bacterium]
TGGRVQVAGDVETLLAGHQILTGPSADAGTVGGQFDVVHAQRGLAQAHSSWPAAPCWPPRCSPRPSSR